MLSEQRPTVLANIIPEGEMLSLRRITRDDKRFKVLANGYDVGLKIQQLLIRVFKPKNISLPQSFLAEFLKPFLLH